MIESKLEFTRGTATWQSFDRLEDMSSEYRKKCIDWPFKEKFSWLNNRKDDFYGESITNTLKMVTTGWDDGANKADKILDLIEGKLDIESSAYKSINTVVGSTVNVGAFLAGNPASMRLRKKVMQNTNPINIILDVTCTWNVDHNEIFNKGVATLALVRVLSESRPVNLEVISGINSYSENVVFTIPINTSPLDLSRASFMLSRPEVFRRICFGLLSHHSMSKLGSMNERIPLLFCDPEWQRGKFIDEYADKRGFGNDYVGISSNVKFQDPDGKLNTLDYSVDWVLNNAKRLLALKGDM